MSVNLGSLNNRLRLRCATCHWLLPDGMTMEAAQLHMQVEHDTDDVKLELMPVCRCGEAMAPGESHQAGKQVTDFWTCGVDGNTGHTTRKAES